MSLHTHEHDDENRRQTTEQSTRRLAFVAVINFVGFDIELGEPTDNETSLVGTINHSHKRCPTQHPIEYSRR